MKRLGLATLVLAAAFACEKADSSNPPEAEPEPTPAAEPAEEPTDAPAPEPEPEPAPAPADDPDEAEVSEVEEAVVERGGFHARDLNCKLNNPTKRGRKYILTGLANKDDILDACAPQGAAIQVEWEYVSGLALNAAVTAQSDKVANCVSDALAKVGAGVEAKCTAILLLGDVAAATAAYEAR